MREVKVPGMGISVPKGSAFACATPPMAPKMHLLGAVVARRVPMALAARRAERVLVECVEPAGTRIVPGRGR